MKTFPGIRFKQPGPRSPEFANQSTTNTAIYLNGKNTRLQLPDTFGPKSPFKFRNGDAITIEAWIKPDKLPASVAAYIIGKGRTSDPKFAKDNQNWSLRIASSGTTSKLSFLFATKAKTWHRWNSTLTFGPKSVWHHVALTYQFGR
ncbi:MAG: LamG-like jellyroll fold domain-containing protein, partial [Limisphaerales bacterium]